MTASPVEADFRAAVCNFARSAGVPIAENSIQQTFGIVNHARGSATLCFRVAVPRPDDIAELSPMRGFALRLPAMHGDSTLQVDCVLSGALVGGRAHDWAGQPSDALA